MDKIVNQWKWASYALVGLGVLIFVGTLLGDSRWADLGLPLVFFMLATIFILLAFSLSERWLWAVWFFVPGTLLLSFGIIFLLNTLTGDWNAWAYAWLLLVAGAGAGLILAGWHGQLRQEFLMAGVGAVLLGVTLFAIFGVITGGLVIRIAAPLLLVAGGLALNRLRPEAVLPPRVLRSWFPNRESQSSPVSSTTPQASREPLPQVDPLVEPLSARELEVLHLIDRGLSNVEIAERLTLALSTVKTHINNLYGKLNVQTRVQALNRARELKLL
jgi:DNA-binding CsgD family transcriptional regulator